MSEDFGSDYEQHELQQEVETQIRAWGKAIVENPALQQVMRAAQEQVLASVQPCHLCTQKRYFVQCVQTLSIVHMLTVVPSHAYGRALSYAIQIPATALPSVAEMAIGDVAWEFFQWQCGEGAKPAWFPATPFLTDGHE